MQGCFDPKCRAVLTNEDGAVVVVPSREGVVVRGRLDQHPINNIEVDEVICLGQQDGTKCRPPRWCLLGIHTALHTSSPGPQVYPNEATKGSITEVSR